MYQCYILIVTVTSLGKSALLTNLFSQNLFIKLHCEEKKNEQILWTKKVLAQEGGDICVSDSHHYIAKTQHCKALIFQFKNNSKQIKAYLELGFPGGASGKEPACQCRRHKKHRFNLNQEDPLEEEMAIHSSIFVWRIPWTEEPAKLQSIGSQRVRHD